MPLPPRPHRAAATALLVCATLAEAQQPPGVRVRREQQLVLARVPVGSEPELRVAPGIPTVVRFDAAVAHAEVKGEGPGRLVWLDVAGLSLLLEPRRELAPDEKLSLEVVLVQGSTRTRLVFQLVSRPGEVDARMDVVSRPPPVRSAQEPEATYFRREVGPFSHMLFSGVMRMSGVTASVFQGRVAGNGVRAVRPWDYRTERGRAIAFFVHNPEGVRPWVTSEVVRLSPTSAGGGKWAVFMEAPIEPGGSGLVVVESAEEESGAPVRLEVREEGGSRGVRVEDAR